MTAGVRGNWQNGGLEDSAGIYSSLNLGLSYLCIAMPLSSPRFEELSHSLFVTISTVSKTLNR